jgi:hypothetical protein
MAMAVQGVGHLFATRCGRVWVVCSDVVRAGMHNVKLDPAASPHDVTQACRRRRLHAYVLMHSAGVYLAETISALVLLALALIEPVSMADVTTAAGVRVSARLLVHNVHVFTVAGAARIGVFVYGSTAARRQILVDGRTTDVHPSANRVQSDGVGGVIL